LGFGPATFQTAFPYYTKELGAEISGVWLYAHDDYLQTLVEWGWVGGLCWAIYLLGGVGFSWLTVYQYRKQISSTDRIACVAIVSALIGVLIHASMDFPLQVPSIELYVLVLLGMVWSLLGRLEKRSFSSTRLAAVR
jgi:O-antigen ligase